MKKTVAAALALALAGALAFCETFDGAEEMVDNFLRNGSYVKIVRNEKNIYYFPRSAVAGISVDEDDMGIATTGYNVWLGKTGDTQSFYNTKRWKFSSDENGNIIIERK